MFFSILNVSIEKTMNSDIIAISMLNKQSEMNESEKKMK